MQTLWTKVKIMGTGYIGITLLKSIILVVSGWNLTDRKRLEIQNIKKNICSD